MRRLKILSWSDERAWTTWSGRLRSDFAWRLQRAFPQMRNTDVKRLARSVIGRECYELLLPDSASVESIRHPLEATGAEVAIEDVEA
jgi:hypothetical protein